LLQAARREGENSSPENLPDDGIIMRVRTDANTGGKFHGRRQSNSIRRRVA